MSNSLGRLHELPREILARTPTHLEKLPRLSSQNGGAEIWVKRDDETGLAFGGNKVRQLEYYFGAAVAERADTVLITGAVQSNFVRLAAAAAAKLAMDCHVQLEDRVPNDDPVYRMSGNVLLDHLLGATIHTFPQGEDEEGADLKIHEIAESLRAAGRRPYVIPLSPGHPPLGSLGYIDCAREIIGQIGAPDIPRFDRIFVASGSGSTHGGLLFGLRAMGDVTPVTGVCVRRTASLQGPRIVGRCQEIAALLGIANPVSTADVVVTDDRLEPGYGQLNDATREAVRCTARLEALLLDPVYTGKVMADALATAAKMDRGQKILVIHTGGTPALFAYANDLMDQS